MPGIEPQVSAFARFRKAMWFTAAIAFLLGVIGYLVISSRQAQRGGNYAAAFGGQFAMSDQNGRTVTARTLSGKPYAIFFGFTRCPDICPTTLNRMAQLRKALGADGMKFEIVFVSLDPGHDTRQNIGNYLTLFGTPIIGLSGTDAQLAEMVKAFHVYYEKVPVEGGDYTIDHSASVFLMDADGRFITTIDHHENEAAALSKLRRLIADM